MNLASITAYCRNNWSFVSRGNPGRNPKEAAQLGLNVYTRAKANNIGFMIIGENRLRDDQQLTGNMGKILGNLSNRNLKKMEPHQYQGALLAEPQWSPFINDLFILGGGQANKVFYLSNPRGTPLKEDSVWKENQPTTLGRELYLLQLIGYSKVNGVSKLFGHIFVPPKEPVTISLEEVQSSLQQLSTPNTIMKIFENGVDYTNYLLTCI